MKKKKTAFGRTGAPDGVDTEQKVETEQQTHIELNLLVAKA